MELNRRSFLKGAGTGVVAAAMTAAAGSALAVPAPGVDVDAIDWADEAEVVVVGCGSGGAPAAIEAARAGADVLVYEKMDWLGGCMRRCGGGLIGCNTLVQQKLGVEDPGVDTFYQYMCDCTLGNYDADILRQFAEEAGPTVDWVITPVEEGGLGGQPLEEWEFVTAEDEGKSGKVAPGLNVGSEKNEEDDFWGEFGYGSDIEHRRVHWFKPNLDDVDPGDRFYAGGAGSGSWISEPGGGTGLWMPFEEELYNLDNVRIETETELVSIITDADGQVIGVRMQPTGSDEPFNVKATKGVVIATGTFVVNKEMFENFTGRKWTYEEDPRSIVNGSAYNDYQADGAGIAAMLAVGAAPRYILEGNSGGVRINTDSQVIDMKGEVIPRLYTAGRTVGGLFADARYPQCGVYVTASIVNGRHAGQHVVTLEPWA